MDPRDEVREKREKLAAAAAACEVLKALGSKAARAAQELRTALSDGKPAPPALVNETHDALLAALMDRRVKSAQIERKKLFGIPLEAELPTKSRMRDLVKRFELAFMRRARAAGAAGSDRA
jgi:hypothetical protein